MTEHVTSSRGDRVAYDRYGTAGGPALVLVAGAGSLRGGGPVTATAELLVAQGVDVLVPDRLGRGESPAEGPLDLDREVAALRAVVDAAGGHAVLVGHSSGCSISLYAAAQGVPVDGLVLWEAPVDGPAAPVAAWVEGLEERLDRGELEAAQEWYMRDMPPEWLAGAKASPAWPQIYAGSVSLRADGQSLRWATAQLESGDLREQVRVPVLATYGTSTFPGMVRAAERIRSGLPQAEVREVPGANHMWDAAGFAPVLTGFVRSCSATG
jgi:pimeloyl-ACP methyl ester carboxylesterase